MKRRGITAAFALWLATAGHASGQVQAGQLNMNLAGNVSGGYTADYGNTPGSSDHGFTAGGNANLTGSYYDPNFLNFTVQPFYNESWANSDYQSIIDSSGVSAGAGIFGGSNFPGSVSYSKSLNSSGNFGIPGIANYTSHGDSTTFSVGWTEHLENLPVISLGYQQGSSTNSLYGATSDIGTEFHGINATINYMIAGFTLTGGYHYLDSQLSLPEILGIQEPETSHSTNNSYSFGVGHKLPFNGSISGAVSRSSFSSDYTGGTYNGTLDTINGGLSFNPISNLNLGANAQYNDNLLGSLYQPILAEGGILPGAIPEQSSHALDLSAYGNYQIPDWHLTISAMDEHRDEVLFGLGLTSDVFTGTVSYTNSFMGGFLTAVAGGTESTVHPNDQTHLGVLGSVSYTRTFRKWSVAASGNYAQDAQTLLISYTTNSYGYSANMTRKLNRVSRLAFIASGSKARLSGDNSSGSFSQSYSANLSIRRLTASAGYTRSSGNGIITGTGVASTSLLIPVISPTSTILYGGSAYSASLGTTPFRGLTISASYSRAISNTETDTQSSNNRSEQLNMRVQYLIRKVYFQAGYLRLVQGFSLSGEPPVMVGSVYVGLARWFNFF